jgi:tetrahydromethanopterin S-methyltransferase subunit G
MSESLQEKLDQAAKELEIVLAELLQKIERGEDI